MRKTIPAIGENAVLKSLTLPVSRRLCFTRCAEFAWKPRACPAVREGQRRETASPQKGQCPKRPVPKRPVPKRPAPETAGAQFLRSNFGPRGLSRRVGRNWCTSRRIATGRKRLAHGDPRYCRPLSRGG